MLYRFKITENERINAIPVSDDGTKLSSKDILDYIKNTDETVRRNELNDQFVQWAKENGVELKIDKLPYWAREGLEDTDFLDIQNAEPLTLLKWILEYNGIIGYENVIAETVLALFNKKEGN